MPIFMSDGAVHETEAQMVLKQADEEDNPLDYLQTVGSKIEPLSLIPKNTPGNPTFLKSPDGTLQGLGSFGLNKFRQAMDEQAMIARPPEPATKGTLERQGQNTFNREVRRAPDGTLRTKDQMQNDWEGFNTPIPKKVVEEKKPEEGEKITGAAVAYKDKVYTGATHIFTAMDIADQLNIPFDKVLADVNNAAVPHAQDGFMTTTGRFVSRAEALTIANQTNQNVGPAEGHKGEGLFFAKEQDKQGLIAEDLKSTKEQNVIPLFTKRQYRDAANALWNQTQMRAPKKNKTGILAKHWDSDIPD